MSRFMGSLVHFEVQFSISVFSLFLVLCLLEARITIITKRDVGLVIVNLHGPIQSFVSRKRRSVVYGPFRN